MDKDEDEDDLIPTYSSATILEEDEGSYTPEDEKRSPLDDDEDESGNYSPIESSYPPSSLNRAVNRLTLDFSEGFDFGSNSPDSPHSFQEILDIGSGTVTNSGSSSSLPLKEGSDVQARPTFI